MTTVLTGITTTGTPHLGNYVGAIKPAIESSKNADVKSYFFLADFHALIKCWEPQRIAESTKQIAATWMALGLDTDTAFFYRQSDIPEIPELTWLLTCMAAKGLMNRSHAYKAQVAENLEQGEDDPDKGITMGLFSYPVLMAADILMFNANEVPVGKDQTQHLEMTRDIGARFNHHFGDHFVMPKTIVDDEVAVLPGLDGRKMSKSYNNTIPLWLPEKKLRKHIMKIKTNSLEPGEPKDPSDSHVFSIYRAFATQEQTAAMRQAYADGIAWGEAKQQLFELINDELKEPRERYEGLIQQPDVIEQTLLKGADRAREFATPFLAQLKQAVGIKPIA
ncbi:tryptophan--tRNA ligase [Marinicella sp. W31]|uniref:tryptophan--tRNA ligase n=1 Tax=Marinicella sp. W31 TaxID=3023713 RepID=UPI0037572AFC